MNLTTHDLELIAAIRDEITKLAFLQKDVLTSEEAASYTGLTERTVLQYAYERKIASHKPAGGHSGKVYFLKTDLNEYMTRNRQRSEIEIESEALTYKRRAS